MFYLLWDEFDWIFRVDIGNILVGFGLLKRFFILFCKRFINCFYGTRYGGGCIIGGNLLVYFFLRFMCF